MGPAKKPAVAERLRTRHDERFQLRLKKEVDEVYGKMVDKFHYAVVTAEDPEGYEIKRLSNQLDAQWRLLCHRKNLIASIYPAMRRYTNQTLADYLTLLDESKRHTPPVDAEASSQEDQRSVLQHEAMAESESAVVVEGTGETASDPGEGILEPPVPRVLEVGEDHTNGGSGSH